jgi:hypothetical protein
VPKSVDQVYQKVRTRCAKKCGVQGVPESVDQVYLKVWTRCTKKCGGVQGVRVCL